MADSDAEYWKRIMRGLAGRGAPADLAGAGGDVAAELLKRGALRQDPDSESPVVLPEPPDAVQVRVLRDLLPTIVPEGATDEQRALLAAAACSQRLLGDVPEISQVSAVMITLRRCYAVAYRELQDLLAAQPEGTLHHMTQDTLVGAAMAAAAKPFSEHELVRSLPVSFMPWLLATIDRHSEADEQAAREAREENARRRASTPIPIGLSLQHGDGLGLTRDRGVVLVGRRGALLWLLDRIAANVLVAREHDVFHVLRLMVASPRREDRHAQLVRLGSNAWAGCCDTSASMAVKVGGRVLDMLSAPPDLLICEDMSRAFTKSYTGRPAAATAGDAYRRFEKWCMPQGCAFLGLVPTEEPAPPNLMNPEWEQLRTFATVIAVTVTDDPGDEYNYRIVIGNYVTVLTEPRAIIDGYGWPTIIT